MGQSGWRQRFDSPTQKPAQQSQQAGFDPNEIKQYVDYLRSLNPEESIQNLNAWIEYLNSELEKVKQTVQQSGQGVNPQDWSAAEDEFGGGAEPQQQSYPTVWESFRDMFKGNPFA